MQNGHLRRTALFLLASAGFALAQGAEDRPTAEPFFAAAFADVENRPFAASALRGKPLLLNFWATWCSPCRTEIPALDEAARKGKPRNLAVVGIALDDDAGSVRAFAADQEIGYPILVGKDEALALMRELGNDRKALPFTVAVDRNGSIVDRKFGVLRRGDFARMLTALGQGAATKASHLP